MQLVGYVRDVARAFYIGFIAFLFALAYGFRRLGTMLVSDPALKRAKIAHIQGQMLRSFMSTLGACFVKLGQVMSSRPDLFEPELINELRLLQDKLPAFGFDAVQRTLTEDLKKPIDAIFSEFDEKPVAAASVAQVHRARLRDGREVAVKVLRPSIRAQVERDGSLLMFGAKILALHPVLRLSDPVGFTREFADGLARQTDLRVEAANYQMFRHNFRNEPRITFPEVHEELTTQRVLVMEFVRGQKVDALPPGNHRPVADALRSATMQMLFADGFMHADMHPGNMVLRDDGVVVLFDVGLATKLRPEILEMFVDLMKCIAMGTPDDTVQHLKRYHIYLGSVDWVKIRADFEEFGKRFRSQDVSKLDYGEMTGEILAIARRYHVHPVPELSLVIVGVVTSQGIGKMLSPDTNDFQQMSEFLIPIIMRGGQKLPDTDEARRAHKAVSDRPAIA